VLQLCVALLLLRTPVLSRHLSVAQARYIAGVLYTIMYSADHIAVYTTRCYCTCSDVKLWSAYLASCMFCISHLCARLKSSHCVRVYVYVMYIQGGPKK